MVEIVTHPLFPPNFPTHCPVESQERNKGGTLSALKWLTNPHSTFFSYFSLAFPYLAMADPTYPLYPTFAFLGFILSLIPLPWHLQAWNSGTCYFMMWSTLACLNQFINSVVWAGNALNPAPAWCEICQSTSCILFYSSDARPSNSNYDGRLRWNTRCLSLY